MGQTMLENNLLLVVFFFIFVQCYLEYYQRLSGYPPLLEERVDTVGYSSPHIYRIKMNWGWWTQWKDGYGWDDDWYALTGGWYVHSGDQYDQDINILCDYSFAL